ncbi:hypothetical protein H5410_041746 [Solanum commersonii]|uniref:Uncharacterized protein n=1 Tax=Solanum commersonii TaxID=4109 RepID=A0A9J5XVL3_SOLCO|nr:hypothetical protein H5410_041746 [Solanum commersonii]
MFLVLCLCVLPLVPRGKRTYLQVQTSPKVSKTRYYQLSYAIIHGFLVIRDFGLFFADIFHGRLLRP